MYDEEIDQSGTKEIEKADNGFGWISQHSLFVYHYFCAANAD